MFNELQVLTQSVDDRESTAYPTRSQQSSNGILWYGQLLPESDLLARWGQIERPYQLRQAWYGLYNTMPVGAQVNLVRRWVGTNWELRSEGNYKPRVIKKWQERLQNAELGQGWGAFLWRIGQDFLNQDLGAWIEIVGRGAAHTPLKGEVLGIKSLDALRCYPTGDPEFPVWYLSHKTNSLHKIHRSRVRRIVDNPSPDPDARGMGYCASSRVFAIQEVQALMHRYRYEQMNDQPPKGIVSISNVNHEQWRQMVHAYENDRISDNQSVFRNLMEVTGIDPSNPVKVDVTPFSTIPDGFNYRESMEMDANLIALAIGEDPQEILPLTGRGIGSTATQSETLHKKAQGKTFGTFLSELERIFNIFILPPELELTFKQRDQDGDKASAEAAKVWTGVALDLKNSTGMSNEQAASFLSRVIPEVADVLLDESGQLILLNDTDEPSPEQVEDGSDIALDQAQPNQPIPQEQSVQSDEAMIEAKRFNKAIQATRSDFENDFEDILLAANSGSVSRRRASIRARAIIARDINKAFRDALELNGVPESSISQDDLKVIDTQVRLQSGRVTDLMDKIYKGGGLSDDELANKPAMWWNGSIQPAYNAGIMSADRNGMYEFVGPVKPDSCPDCKRLKGQIHRFKDFQSKGLDVPHVGQSTECNGYHCVDRLVKRPGARARGRF